MVYCYGTVNDLAVWDVPSCSSDMLTQVDCLVSIEKLAPLHIKVDCCHSSGQCCYPYTGCSAPWELLVQSITILLLVEVPYKTILQCTIFYIYYISPHVQNTYTRWQHVQLFTYHDCVKLDSSTVKLQHGTCAWRFWGTSLRLSKQKLSLPILQYRTCTSYSAIMLFSTTMEKEVKKTGLKNTTIVHTDAQRYA